MGSVTPAGRSRPSRRFLRCFQPEINDEKRVAAGEKEGVVFPNVLPVLKPAKENDAGSVSRRRKEANGSGFARIMRAVVFETALAKKMRKKKTKQKSCRQELIGDEPATKPPATPSKMKKSASESELTGIGRCYLTDTCTGSSSSSININSNSTSSLTSSARSSPSRTRPSNRPKPSSNPQNPSPPDPKAAKSKSNSRLFGYTVMGLFSILLSLVAVIFWGKACAIFCTSACLFVVPRLGRPRSEFSPPGSAPVSEEIQKKRVVMDGFLDRSGRRS